jgi:hypothetical protein
MLIEAAHTSDPSFDPAMVLFKSIIQVDARSVADSAAQRRADRARIGVMPVGCHPVWPPAFKHDFSRYAISSISDLAAMRSDVAKPSVNRL